MGSFGSFFEFGISVEPVPCKSNRIQQFRMNNSLSHNSGTGGLLDRYQHGYDRACNRLFRNNLVNSAMSELYGYDNLNQLTDFARGVLSDANSDGMLDSVASPSRTQTWSLDSLGNWSTFTTNSTSQSRTHNAQNQVTGVGSTSLTYDANGSMTADESGRIFVYDAWNRLAAVRNTANSPIVGYSYDALGRRIIEDRPNANTVDHLYYSTAWQVLEERRDGTSSGDVRRQYLWSIDYVDALTARVDYASGAVSATYHAQYDANWNVTAIADASSGVLERYIYDPYGTATVLYANWSVRGGSPYGWNSLHQGGRFDVDTNLYHFRHRDYSATLGRWTQTDPIGFEAGDTNLYRYVGNGPVNGVDPSGLAEKDCGMSKRHDRPIEPRTRIVPPMDWIDCMAACVHDYLISNRIVSLGSVVPGVGGIRLPKGVTLPGQKGSTALLSRIGVRYGLWSWPAGSMAQKSCLTTFLAIGLTDAAIELYCAGRCLRNPHR